jgi:hypothetical protein
MTTIVLLGLFWLLGPGLLAPILFGQRTAEPDKLPSRFEYLRATSTYRSVQPGRSAGRLRRASG